MSITIRQANDRDREGIWRVHTEAIRASCTASYSETQIAAWTALLTPDVYRGVIVNHRIIVAEAADGIVGFGQLDPKGGEVVALYVLPRAERRGIGSKMLARLERGAGAIGLALVWVRATLNAESFYAGRGYRRKGIADHDITPGVRLACVVMEKVLIAAV